MASPKAKHFPKGSLPYMNRYNRYKWPRIGYVIIALVLYIIYLLVGKWTASEHIQKTIKGSGKTKLPTIHSSKRTAIGRCVNELNCVECPSDFLPEKLMTSVATEKRLSFGQVKKPKAVITILCRNKDLHGVLSSLASFEPLINSKFAYPYVFLNNEDFSEAFMISIRAYLSKFRANPQVKFSKIPKEHWDYPSFINQTKAAEIRKITKSQYIYGGLESYRFMIRYFSGPFFLHPDLQEYDYYWRVEPDVDFFCDIQYDPFMLMQEKKIKYGFNIMIPELMKTVPTLYQTMQEFKRKKGLSGTLLMNLFQTAGCGGGEVGTGVCADGSCCSIHGLFLIIAGWCGKTADYCEKEKCARNCHYASELMLTAEQEFAKKMAKKSEEEKEEMGYCGGGKVGNGVCKHGECCSKWGYCGFGMDYCNDLACINNCKAVIGDTLYNGNHFWSNFEIADFRFFRSKKYMDYFEHLDKAGGFFYERWGDAPVHSLAVGLYLEPKEVHYFGGLLLINRRYRVQTRRVDALSKSERRVQFEVLLLDKPNMGIKLDRDMAQAWWRYSSEKVFIVFKKD